MQHSWTEHVSEFCTKLTGITNQVLQTQGIPLEQAIAEFDQEVRARFGSNPDSYCIATDGPWDLQVRREKPILLRLLNKMGPFFF